MDKLTRCRAAPCWAARRVLASPAIIRPARAAERCVVGTWGGDYARLLRENIDDPILKPAGVEVVQDIGDEAPRFAKLVAQKMLPRGTMDIACLGAPNGYRAGEAGLVEKLDPRQGAEPEARAAEFLRSDFSCRTSTARRCIVYNPQTRHRSAADVSAICSTRNGRARSALSPPSGFWLMMAAACYDSGNADTSTRPRR